MGKPGGVFECDSCGMEHSTEWAKAKIQEIKGMVKVEGTVEVTGKVKVDGPIKVEGGVRIESLLKRGYLALADQKWPDATAFFDEALNYDAECAEAYPGKLMAELQVSQRADLADYPKAFDDNDHFKKILRFGDPAILKPKASHGSFAGRMKVKTTGETGGLDFSLLILWHSEECQYSASRAGKSQSSWSWIGWAST